MKMNWLIASATVLLSAAAQAADAPKIDGPVYATTYIEVAPDAAATALNALREYRKASLQESAKAADIFQENGQPSRFVVTELWSDAQALAGHQKSSAF